MVKPQDGFIDPRGSVNFHLEESFLPIRNTHYDFVWMRNKLLWVGEVFCYSSFAFEHAQSCLTLVTPWIVAHQAPLSMEFSRQEYWSGLPFPPPGDLPDWEIEPTSLVSPLLAGGFFTSWELCHLGSHYSSWWMLFLSAPQTLVCTEITSDAC